MSRQQAIEFLQAIRGGALLDEFYNAIAAARSAQQEHGRKASVTVTFTVEGVKDATDRQMVSIGATVTKKLPNRDAFRQILFVAGDGGLFSVRDPRQPDMFTPTVVPGSAPADDAQHAAQSAGGTR